MVALDCVVLSAAVEFPVVSAATVVVAVVVAIRNSNFHMLIYKYLNFKCKYEKGNRTCGYIFQCFVEGKQNGHPHVQTTAIHMCNHGHPHVQPRPST